MNYLFLGNDTPTKIQKISDLKIKYLTHPDASKFDYDVFYGSKLDSQDLKKSVLNLPVVCAHRLIIIHQCHKLSDHNIAIIREFFESKVENVVLILDSDEPELKSSLMQAWRAFVNTTVVHKGTEQNVFDMTNALSKHKTTEALQILSNLFAQDIHPLQIMGGLVWYWGKQRQKIAPEHFKNGLRMLKSADLNIKRSRLKPEHAVEKVVVELSGLATP